MSRPSIVGRSLEGTPRGRGRKRHGSRAVRPRPPQQLGARHSKVAHMTPLLRVQSPTRNFRGFRATPRTRRGLAGDRGGRATAPGRLDGAADRRRTTVRAASPDPAIPPEVPRHQQAPCYGGYGALGSLPGTASDFPDSRFRRASRHNECHARRAAGAVRARRGDSGACPPADRVAHSRWLRPGVPRLVSAQRDLLSIESERALLQNIGRPTTAQHQPAGTYAKRLLDRLLLDLSWNSSRLEGNTYSLLDTKRLIELGEKAEGKQRHEAQMILNHKAAIEFLVSSAEEVNFNRHTILNLHALLADNLLGDPAAVGRLRRISVGIERSVFRPLEVPQLIEECFDELLATSSAIVDPFAKITSWKWL